MPAEGRTQRLQVTIPISTSDSSAFAGLGYELVMTNIDATPTGTITMEFSFDKGVTWESVGTYVVGQTAAIWTPVTDASTAVARVPLAPLVRFTSSGTEAAARVISVLVAAI